MRVAGAVLTGGASRRMGRTKALVDVDGVPMAQRVATALLEAGCAPVTLVGGGADLDALGLVGVADLFPGEGPVGGVITALRHHAQISVAADAVIVAACDLPLLDASTVRTLLAALGDHDHDVVVARTDRREPALAVWPASTLPQIEVLFENGVRALYEVLDALVAVEVAVDPGALLNVNHAVDIPPEGAG